LRRNARQHYRGWVTMEAVASLLLTHDAALDEHHDQPAFRFVVAQAVSSGSRKGLTLIEGLPVSRLHIVHHVAHAPLLLGDSGATDTDGDEDGNNQGVHVCLLCGWLQITTRSSSKNFDSLSLCARWIGCSGTPFISDLLAECSEGGTNLF